MTGAQIVGKVGIKLVPDSTGFRKDARNLLRRVEKSLPKIKVGIELNEAGLKAEALRAVRQLNRDIRNNDLYKVKFSAKIDVTRSVVREATRELNAIARGERIKFKADVAAALVEGEMDKDAWRKLRKELEDWRDKISPLKITVQPEMLNGAGALVSARLASLTRPRTVRIVPVLDNKAAAAVGTALAALSGGRVLWDTLDGLMDRLKRLDKLTPIIGTMAEAAAGLSAFLLTAASNMFALAQSLAQIGPAALVLPGILGGMAIGLGVTIAALKDFNDIFPDFKDKLSELQDIISTRFWEGAEAPIRRMIDTLFPLLRREFASTAGEIGQFFGNFAASITNILAPAMSRMFDDLHRSIAIASGYTDDFVRILTILGRTGSGYLPRLARWFGEMGASFGDWLARVEADNSLQRWIDNGIFQFKELGRAIGNLGGIFNGLAEIARKAGGSTLTVFADTLQSIEDTVKGATFQRVLTDALRAAHEGMDRIARYSGPAFKRLMENLGETATIIFPMMGETVGVALAAIFDALDQPEVMQGLVAMFQGIQDAVKALAPAMDPLARAFGAIMEVVGTLAPVIGEVLAVALSTVADIIVDLAPVFMEIIELLGTALVEALEIVSPFLKELGDALVVAFEELLPHLEPVLEAFLEMAETTIPALFDAVIELLPEITDLVIAFADLFEAVAPLIPFAVTWAEVWIDTVGEIVGSITQMLTGLIEIISGFISGVGALMTGDWRGVFDSMHRVAQGGLNLVSGLFRLVMSSVIAQIIREFFVFAFQQAATGMARMGQAVSGGLSSVRGFFVSGFATMVRLAAGFVSDIVGRFRELISRLPAPVREAGSAAVRALTSAARDLLRAAGDGVRWVVEKVGELRSKIPNAISGISLFGIGVSMMQGLAAGIGSMAASVAGKAASVVAGAVRAAKGALRINSPSKVFIDIGKSAGEGLVVGIDRMTRPVSSAMRSMVETAIPEVPTFNSGAIDTRGLSAAVDGAAGGSKSERHLHYYAAPGSSLDSEEDLFAAANRERMVGW